MGPLKLMLVFFVIVDAKTLIWSPDLSFGNVNNWTPKRRPCPNDRVIFPKVMEAEISLSEQYISVQEIVLPVTGSIQLREDGILTLSDANLNTDQCSGEDIKFTSKLKYAWMESSNWKSKYSGNKAVPHYDRLPCVYDTVKFPTGKTFTVLLPERTEQVAKIIYNEQPVSMHTWKETIQDNPLVFQMWPDGDVSPVDIDPNVKQCADGDLCLCHVNKIPYELCDNEMNKCPPTLCLNPIWVKNHCCKICGSVIQIKPDETFDYPKFVKIVHDALEDYNDIVDYYIGPVFEDSEQILQVVIVEKNEYDETSIRIGKHIASIVDKEYTMKPAMLNSGIPWLGPNAPKGGWEVFMMFVLIGLAIVGVIAYYYPPAFLNNLNPFRPHHFARFDNRSREGSLVLGVSHLSLDKAFDNPMYRKSAKYEEDDRDGAETEIDEVFESSDKEDDNKD